MDRSSIAVLEKIDFLKKIPEEILEDLVAECQFKDLRMEEVLFEEGQEGSSMYVIISGEVLISKNGINIAHRKKGDYFGEMALIESLPRSASVKSLKEGTRLLEIKQKLFHSRLSSNPDVLIAIMKTLSVRARENLKILDSKEAENPRARLGGDSKKLDEHLKYLMQESGLTAREAEVARLTCEGLSDKEIGNKLFISPHTVKDHLKKIYTKFEVHGRVQLVSLLYK